MTTYLGSAITNSTFAGCEVIFVRSPSASELHERMQQGTARWHPEVRLRPGDSVVIISINDPLPHPCGHMRTLAEIIESVLSITEYRIGRPA